MWDKRESNTMYGGQNMNFDSGRPEVAFLQSRRFPPPNNSPIGQYFAEVSRKRKSMDTDPGHGVSARFFENMGGNMGHPLQREHTLQHNVALPPPVDSRMLFNHNSEYSNPSNAQSQYGAVQFYNMDISFLSSETKDENVKKDSSGIFPPFHHEEPSFPVHTLPVHSEHHDSKHPACDMANRDALINVPAHYKHNGLMGMSQVAHRSDDGKKLEHGNNSIPFNAGLYPFNIPSNNITTFGSSNQRVVNENFHSDAVSCCQMFSKTGPSEEKECGQVIRVEEASNISIAKTHSTQAPSFIEGREAYDLYQCHDTEMRPGSSISRNLGADLNLREQNVPPTFPLPRQTESSSKDGCLDHVSRDFDTKLLGRNEGSNTENTSHQSGQETLLRGGNSLADRSVEPDDRLPLNLDERTHSVAGKVSPLIAEKLWDGSLQLSTSTTVSAVAFFKSGEKAQDATWPEHVEIKGKVRLQAFEKFIQELPRSRNRTLMVISLCWKPGSPEAGLAGMKEVARGYKEGQKVGFAQICPGLDLYVCPRSDTIITILAKYGFFKGMAAVVDDQDSLIGCVIWRRGHASSNPVPQISEKNKTSLPDQLPLNSLELSAPKINSPVTRVDNSESKKETAPSPLISTPDKTRALVAEIKAVQATNNFSHGSDSFRTHSASRITPPIQYSSPLYQVQPPVAQKLEPISLQETVKHTEIPTTQVSEPIKRDGGTELLQPIRPGPPQMLQGVQQQINTQISNGSQNFRSYDICPPAEPRASISSNFTFIGAQLPAAQDSSYRSTPMQSNSKPDAGTAFPGPATAQNLDSSYRPNPIQSNSKTESVQPILPGPTTAQNLDSSYQLNPMQSNLKPPSARPTLPGHPTAQNLDPSNQLNLMQSNSKPESAQSVLPGPPSAQNFYSSYRLNPMPSNSKPESAQPALPGPPPLPPDILQWIIQFNREAQEAPTEGVSKGDISFDPTGEPNNPSVVSEAEQKPNGLDDGDDDGDLPEFDFDSACGIPKAPESRFPVSSHQTHFQFPPFNQQVPVNEVKNETRLLPPPVVKPMDIRQVHASGSPGRPLNTYQGTTTTTLPTRFAELNSEKKPADIPPLNQQFPVKANEGLSSTSSFSRKNLWDDDDDDMPEWCPPDKEHLDVLKPPVPPLTSENVNEPPLTLPSPMTTFHPPLRSQNFSHGYQHSAPVANPAIANPTPVQNRPAGGFVPIDFRLPLKSQPNPSMRPPTTNFGSRPPVSDVSWQWKRH